MNKRTPSSAARLSLSGRNAGFTLIELLVVIAIIAILAAMIIPGLSMAQRRAKATAAMNCTKQLSVAWITYPADNQDELMPNPGAVGGSMSWDIINGDNTNAGPLMDPEKSIMADYIKSTDVFRDPADVRSPDFDRLGKDRVRSFSLNGVLAGRGGSGPPVRGREPNGSRLYYGSGGTPVGASKPIGAPARRTTDLNLPGPAMVFTWLCEHQDSQTDSAFMHEPGYNRATERWRDLPASHHPGPSVAISFADGHAVIHKWMMPGKGEASFLPSATFYTVRFITYYTTSGTPPWSAGPLFRSQDYEWLEDRMPYQLVQN